VLIKGKQIREATIEQRNLNLSTPLNPTDAATKEYVDLRAGITRSSVERYSDKNLEMSANASNGVNGVHLATNIPLLDQPSTGSGVNVYINGIQSNNITFFARKDSNDQPVLPIRDFGEEQLGDYCFFSTVNAQYELTSDDIIDFMYIISDVSEGTSGQPGFEIVESVFGRTGAVVAHYGDYTADMIAYTDNSTSGLNAQYVDNVQDALDDVYNKIENIVVKTKIIYVNELATGNNDGSSWDNAFSDLNDALNIAKYGDEIWVAKGTYYPTDTLDRTISFEIPSGVKIFGGFNGTEKTLNERNYKNNKSVLSGNIDHSTSGSNTNNSYHILTLNNVTNIEINGFEICDANNEDTEIDYGAGILCNNTGDIVIKNIIIKNCVSNYTAGINVNSGTIILDNVEMFNLSVSKYFSSVRALNCSITVQNCYIHDNNSISGGVSFGIGDSNNTINAVFNNNIFKNEQYNQYSVLYFYGSSKNGSVVISNNLFKNCTGDWGTIFGGHSSHYNILAVNNIFDSCSIHNVNNGGTIYNYTASSFYIINNTFINSNSYDIATFHDDNNVGLTFIYNNLLIGPNSRIRNDKYNTVVKNCKMENSINEIIPVLEKENIIYGTTNISSTYKVSTASDIIGFGKNEFWNIVHEFDYLINLNDKDFYGNVRILGENIDLGAVENVSVSDGITGNVYASQIIYDNGTSGLSSQNVQYAIDELNTNISNLTSDDITEGTNNLYYTSDRFSTDFSSKTTDDLVEGGTNGYYTEDRFDSSLATKTTDDVTEGTNNLYYTSDRFSTDFSSKTTDDLVEGGTNGYYTEDRFDSSLATKTTDDITEGTNNLYYTSDRFSTDFSSKTTDDLVEGGTNGYYTEDRFDSSLATKTTDDITEGTNNLYYTDARVSTVISNASINELSDVLIGTNGVDINYVLKWNGTHWIPLSENVLSVFNRTGHIAATSGDYSADQITYDNGTTSISAINVQTAIDEVYAEARYSETDIAPEESLSGTSGSSIITYNIDLTNPVINKINIADGTETLIFTLSFTSDSDIKSREVLVLLNNSLNSSNITTIIFDDNNGVYTWRWAVGIKPDNLVAGINAALYVYNVSNTEVKATWEIEE